MTCLAGFVPNKEEYWVPRATIQIPAETDINRLSNILFPDLGTWKMEQQSAEGDKSKAALHFLHKLVPYFSKCVIQDGVFWTTLFPRNPAVATLTRKLRGNWQGQDYSGWARKERTEHTNKLEEPAANTTSTGDIVLSATLAAELQQARQQLQDI